jgi:hypothetical protein
VEDLLSRKTKHPTPEEWDAYHELERKALATFIERLSVDEVCRGLLADDIYKMMEDKRESGYMIGMIHGYEIAKVFARGKGKSHRAIKKIKSVLWKNPTATNKEIALALDNAEIPLHKSKNVPKTKRLWSEVVKMQYYKNFFSRARMQVVREAHLRDCQERLESIRLDSEVKVTDILDIATPVIPD